MAERYVATLTEIAELAGGFPRDVEYAGNFVRALNTAVTSLREALAIAQEQARLENGAQLLKARDVSPLLSMPHEIFEHIMGFVLYVPPDPDDAGPDENCMLARRVQLHWLRLVCVSFYEWVNRYEKNGSRALLMPSSGSKIDRLCGILERKSRRLWGRFPIEKCCVVYEMFRERNDAAWRSMRHLCSIKDRPVPAMYVKSFAHAYYYARSRREQLYGRYLRDAVRALRHLPAPTVMYISTAPELLDVLLMHPATKDRRVGLIMEEIFTLRAHDTTKYVRWLIKRQRDHEAPIVITVLRLSVSEDMAEFAFNVSSVCKLVQAGISVQRIQVHVFTRHIRNLIPSLSLFLEHAPRGMCIARQDFPCPDPDGDVVCVIDLHAHAAVSLTAEDKETVYATLEEIRQRVLGDPMQVE